MQVVDEEKVGECLYYVESSSAGRAAVCSDCIEGYLLVDNECKAI